MSKGQRRAGGPSRVEETRIAPEDGLEQEAALGAARGVAETRISPLGEGDALETYWGPLEDRNGRAREPRKGESDARTDVGRGGPMEARGDVTGASLLAPTDDRGYETRWGPVETPVGRAALSPYLGVTEDDGASVVRPLRTTFASHSAILTDRLRSKLSKKIYGRGPHRVLYIEAPEGPSTAGGRLARQALSLVPRRGSAPTLICGWVDVSRQESQLRSYEAVARRFEAQHGAPLDMAAEEYERFLRDVGEALQDAGLQVRIVVPDEVPAPRAPAPVETNRRRGVSAVWVFILSALAFGLGFLVGQMPR